MKGFWTLLLAAAMILGAASVYADIITISPENMQGWSIAVGNDGSARFSTAGPITGEIAPPYFEHGRGAYFADCPFTVTPPASTWFGTDQFNGQSLANLEIGRIRKMQYYSYTSTFPVVQGGSGDWKYPKEPICLQLTFTDGFNYRTAMYRPWLSGSSGAEGSNSITGKGSWQFHDCMDEAQNCWYVFEGQLFTTWSGIINQYGSWTLVPTATAYDPVDPTQFMSPGWPNSTPAGFTYSTGTGKCLNFEAGARKTSEKIFGYTSPMNWYKESAGFRGYADWFTFAVDYGEEETPDIVEHTFDFEPAADAAAPRIVALPYIDDAEWTATIDRTFSYNNFVFKIFGLVTAINIETYNPGVMEVQLANGKVIRVRALDGDVAVGDYISATGQLRKLVWGKDPKPIYLWTCQNNIVKFYQQ